jgi:octanoyl-[GcvH]:protein N-octanoyltransferase
VPVVRETNPRPPALEVAIAHALLEAANQKGSGTNVPDPFSGAAESSTGSDPGHVAPGADPFFVVRLYRPAATVAFGRLDALRPGFPAAVRAARAHGFEPVLRAPGGHAVAYHEGCLGIDEVLWERDPIAGLQERFAASSERLAGALATLGVDARVGRVPREFCPGEFTVNARGRVKLVGTAQRVVRHASLLAASIAVTGADALRAVLEDVYSALELDWDPATLGGVADEVAGATVDAVEAAVRAAYPGEETTLGAEVLAAAEALGPRHELGLTLGGGGL